MIFITHIRLSNSNGGNEHITDVKWTHSVNGKTGETSKSGMVDFINQGNKVYVTDGVRNVQVGVVNANPPYLRTYADEVWTDNLLALPRF